MSLISGDIEKRNKVFNLIQRFGFLLTILGYFGGLVFFALQPSDLFFHRTYVSENALSPGLVASDILTTDPVFQFNTLLKNHVESKKSLEDLPELINSIFTQSIKIESFIQYFNYTDPIEKVTKTGKNVYAFNRARRTDGTEGIVVSAPLFLTKSNEETPNYAGISLLLFLSDLVRTKPYWAKDLIFLVNDGFIGSQTWINSYYDFKITQADNLKRRGGSLQAALNLEFEDLSFDKLSIKIEGSNGKLPNLDFFNTIIKICKSQQFKCEFESEKSPLDYTRYAFDRRETADFISRLQNTIQMVLKQATGVPSSSHSEFLNYRIEALTISSVKNANLNKVSTRQNLFKSAKIIEGTLRSLNNLLERFHQSFFFYLLPSSNQYMSIAMYMPPLGLVCLPIIVKIITIWSQIFIQPDSQNKESQETIKTLILLVFLSASFGAILNSGSLYAFSFNNANLTSKDSLIIINILILFMILISPVFIRQKNNVTQFVKFFCLFSLIIALGIICLLNFSLAFLISLIYSPISCLAVHEFKNKFLKLIQLVLVVFSYPAIYFTFLFLVNETLFYGTNLNNLEQIYSMVSTKYYDLTRFSKISGVWSLKFINLILTPVWYSLWFVSFPRNETKVKTN